MSRYLSWKMKILLETPIDLLKYNIMMEKDYWLEITRLSGEIYGEVVKSCVIVTDGY
jgi:hypothetical protein